MSQTQLHLTDDQFAECALDAPSAEVQAHLDVCPQCRAEVAMFARSVADFSSAALNWSEAQPSRSLRAVESAASRRQPVFAYAGAAVAAGVALAIFAPALRHHGEEAQSPVSVVAEEDSAAQIADDNRLMQTVNLAIGVSDPSPFREYQLQDGRSRRGAAHTETRSE